MSKFWRFYFPRLLLAVLAFALMASLFSCNRRVLREIRAVKSRLNAIDSLYNHTQLQLYHYEKARIDSTYNHISDADLLRRIDALTRPKPKGSH